MKIKYTYDRFGAGPGANNYCSNHHILPYHLMYLIGIICLALAKKKESSDKYDYYSKLLGLLPLGVNLTDALGEIKVEVAADDSRKELSEYVFPHPYSYNPETRIIEYANSSVKTAITHLSWLEYNLFLGPKGSLRSDDPSQLGENTRPPSFDKAAGKIWMPS